MTLKGLIVESGTHEQLMGMKGHYAQLVKAQEIEKEKDIDVKQEKGKRGIKTILDEIIFS